MSKSNTAVVPNEKTVNSNWSDLLDVVAPTVIKTTPDPEHDIHLLFDFLSLDECNRLIDASEVHGYGKTFYRKQYRGNLRLITNDSYLADKLWERIQTFVPKTLTESGDNYTATGLNSRWRLAKYFPGDQFQTHVDACFQNTSLKSMYTVNIYMNGMESQDAITTTDDVEDSKESSLVTFQGGETCFHLPGKQTEELLQTDRRKRRSPPPTQLTVRPTPGLCLLFRQPPGASYVHEGLAVKNGIKYLFRTDVMYTKENTESEMYEEDEHITKKIKL